MNALTISCIAVAGVGLLVLLISLPFFFYATGMKKKCSKEVYGTVVDYKYRRAGETYITPLVEYYVDNERYIAYRHYKAIAKKSKITPKAVGLSGEEDCLYVSDKDVLHIITVGSRHLLKK